MSLARLLLLTVVLIAYGSLYPWHLRPAPGENPLWILAHSWPDSLDVTTVKDFAVNILVYLPLGLFALLTFAGLWGPRYGIVATLLTGFLLSVSVELMQTFIAGRVVSMLDVTSDTIGTAIGAAAGMVWRRTLHKPFQRLDAEFLLCCWVAFQCFPFLPHMTHIGRLLPSRLPDAALSLAQQAALVPLIASIRAAREWRRMMLAGLLFLVPMKMFIFTRAVTTGEIACAALILGTAWFVNFRPGAVAGALVVAILIQGLAPYRLERVPHAFWWIPFQASFFSDWEAALTILLGKVFAYGALVWLLRERGWRMALATVSAAALLAAIEVVQTWLPGRSSEITDPLIVLCMGWVFWSLQPRLRAGGSVLSKYSGP